MRGLLIRVGIDDAYGEWNAPIDTRTMDFAWVTIPEDCRVQTEDRFASLYDEQAPECERFARQEPRAALPKGFVGTRAHRDPNFDTLTYGDIAKRYKPATSRWVSARGAPVAELGRGDMILFYAGLRPVQSWTASGGLVYAAIGLYIVDEVLPATEVASDRRGDNPHSAMAQPCKHHVVVRARTGVSGRFDRAIRIGTWESRHYRMSKAVWNAIGGLHGPKGPLEKRSIQRSGAIPRLTSPQRALEWVRSKGVRVVAANVLPTQYRPT